MYQIENFRALFRGQTLRRLQRPQVSGTVLLLGFTSLLTDVSSEMVATILPLYLIYTLGLTPLQFGVIDGFYQGAAALVRVASGVVGDRWRRHKEVAAFGYGLSAVCKPAFLAAGGAWTALMGIILIDRTGKGIRTGPRDALISLSSPQQQLATAFGVHRALDTAGAMLGPLVAFSLLTLVPRGFDVVFVVSFCLALVGLGVLVLFVENQPVARDDTTPAVSLAAAARLVRVARFRVLVLVGSALGLMTTSDGFIYLTLQRRLGFDANLLPLLFVGTALVYMLLALPIGRLADRMGRERVFVGGYVLLVLLYASLLLPSSGMAGLFVCLLLFGTYYAATDGVLMAMASAILPPQLRASGLGLLVTATSVSRLVASVLFGALWTAYGAEAAVIAFAAGLTLAIALSAVAFARRRVAIDA
jgi:MFS family permease